MCSLPICAIVVYSRLDTGNSTQDCLLQADLSADQGLQRFSSIDGPPKRIAPGKIVSQERIGFGRLPAVPPRCFVRSATVELIIRWKDAHPVREEVEDLGIQTGRSEEHTSELQSLMRISYAVY